MRLGLSLILAACAAIMQPGFAGAQTWPDKPIRLIVPYAAGGSTDITARVLAEGLGRVLKQTVIVENKAGAGGSIGVDFVAKSKPDGYTIGIGGAGPNAILPNVDPNLPYNPTRDFEAIATINFVELMLVTRADNKYRNIKDVLEDARANPGKITFSSPGIAGPSHLAVEDLAHRAGVKLVHVPFTGDAPATTAVVSGNVVIGSVSVAAAAEQIAAGTLRALSVGGPERSKLLPDVPTTAELTGFKDYSGSSWNTLIAPKGTPQPIVTALNKAVYDVMNEPDVVKKLAPMGLRNGSGDPAATLAYIAKELARNKTIIDAAGVKRQ